MDTMRTKKPMYTKRRFRNQWDLHLLLLPAVLVTLLFSYFPMYGVIISLKDYVAGVGPGQGVFGSPWADPLWKHFIRMFKDPFFLRALKNSVGISFFRILILFPAPIFLALMFNELRNQKIKRIYQTISYFPYFITWPIVVTMVQLWLSPTLGWVNPLLQNLGIISSPITFLSEPRYFWTITLVLEFWKGIGFSTIVFLAAISGIDPQQYEAAVIDGASRIQKIRYITWPGISGTVSILFILQIPGIIGGNFDVSYLLNNPAIAEKADILQTYVYEMGMQKGRFSYATAMGLVISFVSLILLISGNRIVKGITRKGLF